MDAIERHVLIFRPSGHYEPFTAWLDKLRDSRAKQKIQARIAHFPSRWESLSSYMRLAR